MEPYETFKKVKKNYKLRDDKQSEIKNIDIKMNELEKIIADRQWSNFKLDVTKGKKDSYYDETYLIKCNKQFADKNITEYQIRMGYIYSNEYFSIKNIQ